MGHVETQEEWENRMSFKVLDFVKKELYFDLRFLEMAFRMLTPVPQKNIGTLATDGGNLYFPSEWLIQVFKSNAPYLNRVYLHTILHCLFSHLWIGQKRNRLLWGIACDIAVEYTIDGLDKPSTKRPLSWIRQQFYEQLQKREDGISAAVIYRMLLEKEEDELNKLHVEFYTDDHRFWPKEEQLSAKEAEQREQWNKVTRQTSLLQKRNGEEKEEGERLLAAGLKAEKSRRSYRDFLKKFSVLREETHCNLDEFDLNYYTYGLRVYKNMPLLEPLESREVKKIREFVVALDTSYSTSGDLIRHFLQETFAILTEQDSFFTHCRLHILQCDERVQKDEVVEKKEELQMLWNHFTVVGGGGTDFRPVFTYVNQLIKNGDLKNLGGLLYFTDGKGIYPKKKPDYQTAFLFLGDYEEENVPPWAMRLQLEPEEFLKEQVKK